MTSTIRSTRGGVPIAILLPHAPILVPAVAGARLVDCRETVAAMNAAAQRVVEARPDAVVLVSPHAARSRNAFGMTLGAVAGSLARFGAAGAAVELPGDAALAERFGAAAAARGLAVTGCAGTGLDHGSVVPLWFLAEAGWRGPTVIVALAGDDNARIGELGECVAATAAGLGRRVAVVASGDMSHRLQPGAPCGYDPLAAEFEAAFIAHLRRGATRELAAAVAPWQHCAAEDVVDATLFALGAVGWRAEGREVLSYEGPFGVGYGVAVLHVEGAASAEVAGLEAVAVAHARAALPAVARASIAAALGLPVALAEPTPGGCPGHNGVFVTLHEAGGRLRGCIGTLAAQAGDLAVDTWRMAREAALHDPRFPPVRAEELGGLCVEVTVLEPMEDIGSEEALEPRCWGVVVRAADGRRGLLLPDLPGVTTVTEQVAIARRKAGIGPDEPVRLQRFAALRFEETVRR